VKRGAILLQSHEEKRKKRGKKNGHWFLPWDEGGEREEGKADDRYR